MSNWVNSDSVRNNTIVLITSDHGQHMMHSEIHSTFYGKVFDHRSPLVYVLIPSWLKKKYPGRIQALQLNSEQRVTTNIDLYNTIAHVMLNFTTADLTAPRGQSLFSQIPKERTCKGMGIPESFCTCAELVAADPT